MNLFTQAAAPAGADTQASLPVVVALEPVFDRYADTIIKGRFHEYDAVEVHGVRDIGNAGDGSTCYEIDNVNPKLFSVYVRLRDGGVDCVGDFSEYADAAQYGAELAVNNGWPIRDHVLEQHRKASLQ